MAPVQSAIESLVKRYDNNDNCDYNGCYSTWDNWGRWVALAVIVIAAILLALMFSCYNTRRRRRQGLAPMYGTGWMGGKPGQGYYGNNNNNNQNYYPNQPYNGGQAAPAYSPPVGNHPTGNTFNSNDGYYGRHDQYNGQQSGIELQTPQNSYQPQRGGDSVYEPPTGPPPGKGDGIIR